MRYFDNGLETEPETAPAPQPQPEPEPEPAPTLDVGSKVQVTQAFRDKYYGGGNRPRYEGVVRRIERRGPTPEHPERRVLVQLARPIQGLRFANFDPRDLEVRA
jgi:hypothetical protein